MTPIKPLTNGGFVDDRMAQAISVKTSHTHRTCAAPIQSIMQVLAIAN